MITNTRTIHSFNYFGNNIVFNGDTYEIRVVNNDTFINSLDRYHFSNNYDKSSLQNKETDQTVDQDEVIREFYCPSSNEVQQISLNLTNQCNLKCSYCFNQYKESHNRQGKMQSSTAFKAIDYLMAGGKKTKGSAFLAASLC